MSKYAVITIKELVSMICQRKEKNEYINFTFASEKAVKDGNDISTYGITTRNLFDKRYIIIGKWGGGSVLPICSGDYNETDTGKLANLICFGLESIIAKPYNPNSKIIIFYNTYWSDVRKDDNYDKRS